MKIGIIGLGLIGASLARAAKKYAGCTVYGYDIDAAVIQTALREGVIDGAGEEIACACDIVFVCLFPKAAVEFILHHVFDGVVCDVCGVKSAIAKRISGNVQGYVGVHPMAGKEISGYAAGDADLFLNASLIITKDGYTNEKDIRVVEDFARAAGFDRIVIATPEEHDRMIAYTSQLAHVVSNAYVKSPTSEGYIGYSAGSFSDLTRVARLNPDMWTELFFMNQEHLLFEVETLLENLSAYRNALRDGDGEGMRRLLAEGRDQKEKLDAKKK